MTSTASSRSPCGVPLNRRIPRFAPSSASPGTPGVDYGETCLTLGAVQSRFDGTVARSWIEALELDWYVVDARIGGAPVDAITLQILKLPQPRVRRGIRRCGAPQAKTSSGGTVDNHDVYPAVSIFVVTRLVARAIGRHNGAAGMSRRHAYRNARARRLRPRSAARHQGWLGRPGRCRSARGHPCRRFQPVHWRRAARLRSEQAAPRPGRRAGGSRAIGATGIPTGRQAAVDRVDRPRSSGWVRLGAGARGRGPEPADPRAAAQCPAPRGPTVHPQPDRTRGASLVTHPGVSRPRVGCPSV